MDFEYSLDTKADKTAIVFSYMYLLGRNPENTSAVDLALNRPRTIEQVRKDVMNSEEWRSRAYSNLKNEMIEAYLTCKSEALFGKEFESMRNPPEASVDDILVFQTSDSERYLKILDTSSKYNKIFAKEHGFEYEKYIGVKRGAYPHHAMFNRIHILKELIEKRNFKGWAFYVDADAVVRIRNFNLRHLLQNLRAQDKCMLLHSVLGPDNKNVPWWNINDGCFAIDLGSSIARHLVEAWAGIYNDLYCMADYLKAKSWESEMMNDQTSLWRILDIFNMEPHVYLSSLQGGGSLVWQALRDQHNKISPSDELEKRRLSIDEVASAVYQDVGVTGDD